jgi:chorismate mutase-like protein
MSESKSWTTRDFPNLSGSEIEAENRAALAPLRAEIDDVDSRVVDLLIERFGIVRRIAEVKKARGIPTVQPARMVEVKKRVSAMAAARGLDPQFMEKLYDLLIGQAIEIEDDLMGRKNP